MNYPGLKKGIATIVIYITIFALLVRKGLRGQWSGANGLGGQWSIYLPLPPAKGLILETNNYRIEADSSVLGHRSTFFGGVRGGGSQQINCNISVIIHHQLSFNLKELSVRCVLSPDTCKGTKIDLLESKTKSSKNAIFSCIFLEQLHRYLSYYVGNNYQI